MFENPHALSIQNERQSETEMGSNLNQSKTETPVLRLSRRIHDHEEQIEIALRQLAAMPIMQ